MTDDSRTLQFNLSSLSTADNIVAVNLVLKRPANLPPYKAHLHEVLGGGAGGEEVDLKLLDAGEHLGEWHTIQVRDMVDSVDRTSGWRNYRLILSISGGGGEGSSNILHSIKPMLLVYTNDANLTTTAANLPGDDASPGIRPGTAMPTQGRGTPAATSARSKGSRQQDATTTRRKRSTDLSASGEEGSEMAGTQGQQTPLETLSTQHCQKVIRRRLTFEELGWPGSSFVVLAPPTIDFSFCYGLCNRADAIEYQNLYTNHARVLKASNPELTDEGVVTGCAPASYTPTPREVTYMSSVSKIITMTTIPDITSCRCL